MTGCDGSHTMQRFVATSTCPLISFHGIQHSTDAVCAALCCASRGRKVHDVNPKRPQSGVGPHSLSLVSAVCGVWPLMLMGDADGTLMAWDLLHGRCSSIQTGENTAGGGELHIAAVEVGQHVSFLYVFVLFQLGT